MMLTLLAFVALVAFIFWVMCVIGDRPVEPVLDPQHAEPCDCSGCPYLGWIPVTRRDTGELVLVCSGDYADGQLRGWWTA